MDLTKRVTKLVEKKFGKVIEEELKDRITEEHAFFDVNAYVDELFDKYFTEDDIEIIKREIVENQSYDALVNDDESDNSNETDNYSQESLELDAHEFHTLSTEEIIKNLQNNSEEVRIKCLRELEICGEDLINQTSWNIIKKILQNLLEEKGDRKIQILTLKVVYVIVKN